MKSLVLKTILLNLIFALFIQVAKAEIETYPWPTDSELLDSKYFDIKVRQVNPGGSSGDWIELQEFYSFQRKYADHWKCGGDAGTDVFSDRSLTFVAFAFTGIIEVEVTQKINVQKAISVEIAPKAFGFNPHFFDGTTVRFMMDAQQYVSVNFSFGTDDKSINRDDNRAQGYDIRHGCMIFTDIPESDVTDYKAPNPTDAGVVVWDSATDLSTIRNANIIYFPAGEHQLRNHKDRWERNSSWDKAEAAGNWVTTTAEYNNAVLYRGRLFLNKDNQKVYLAPGAIVYGGFHNHGNDNNWLYGRGIVSGRKHLMHEIIKPEKTIAETDIYEFKTKTKEAFCHFGHGAQYDGIIFHEAWHHTCPSGKNSGIRRTKIIGWCSNNDGIRPAEGSIIDKIFIKTSDDYNYYRGPHVMRNAVMWPGVNGAVGQLGWNDLGVGGAEYYNLHIINSEWHLDNMSKSNIGIINGGKADAGIKLKDNVLQDVQIENRTNYLVAVKLSGNGTGYLRNFTIKNVSTEYPFSNPAGNTVKQELRGSGDTWCENWTFTNLFVDGVLVTWDNYKDYFNLNLTGTNGSNTDNAAKTKNVKFDSFGAIYTITYTKNNGGMVRPTGSGNKIQIAQGMNQSVSIIPDDGYRIKRITVDGHKKYEYQSTLDNQRKQAWVFENVSSNHTIDVEFEAGDDYFDIAYDLLNKSDITIQGNSIYPNPTEGHVYIDNIDKNAIAYVYNIAGIMQEKIAIDSGKSFDLSTLQSGVYILEIIENNKRFITKVIKE